MSANPFFHYRLSLLLLAMVLIFASVKAQPGSLDSTFAHTGKIHTALGRTGDFGAALDLAKDGRIFVAGSTYNGNTDFGLVCYKPDGAVDSTFGIDGIVSYDFAGSFDYCNAVHVLPDGKLLLTGSAMHGIHYDFAALRLDASGNLDTLFANKGMLLTRLGDSTDYSYCSAVQPDGRFILAGTTYNNSAFRYASVRYNTNGSLDTTYGQGGRLVMGPSAARPGQAHAIALQPDGKIILAGDMSLANGAAVSGLLRYLSNGAPDQGFGTQGELHLGGSAPASNCRALAIQANGKILAGGALSNGSNAVMHVIRCEADGSIDQGFGNAGITARPVPGNCKVSALLVQPDTKILLAGSADNGLNDDFVLLRYNAAGMPDSSFGTDGVVLTDFGYSIDDAYAACLQPDGKIILTGSTDNGAFGYFATARYLSGLSLGVNELKTLAAQAFVYPNPVAEKAVLRYTLPYAQVISISLYDISGRLLRKVEDKILKTAGKQETVIEFLPGTPAGTYILLLDNSKTHISIKITKQ